MPFATSAGARLYWREDGPASLPSLLLLNSLGTDHAMWDGVVRALSGRFHVLRMDTRGHGASDAPSGPYTIPQLAEDALAVLDAAGVGQAWVAGVSMGGMTVLQLAISAPQRLLGAIVCNSSGRVPKEAWGLRIAQVGAEGMGPLASVQPSRWFPPGVLAAAPPYVATVQNTLARQQAQGYVGCCAAIRDLDVWDGLPGIDLPVLVLNGTLDTALPPAAHGELVAARIPGAQAASLPTGHLGPLERPDAAAALFADFMQGPPAGLEEARGQLFDAGLLNRRRVLGDAWVDRALAKQGGFSWDFQEFITRFAWSEVWGRPGLDHRTRRMLVITSTIALGRWEELRLHLRSAIEQQALTPEEIKEVLIQSAIYAGVPAANTAFHMAEELLAQFQAKEA